VKHFLQGLFALVLCLIVPLAAFAGDNGYGVVYDGGSLSGVKTGTKVKMYIENDKVRFAEEGKDGREIVIVPASAITEISYGQDVHRRVGAAIGVAMVSFGIGALLALSKSKKALCGPNLGHWRPKGWLRDAVRQERIPRHSGGA
jgi:hypothetical protein